MRGVSRTYRCFNLRISFVHWALNSRRPLDAVRFGPPRAGGAVREGRDVRTARLYQPRPGFPRTPLRTVVSDAIDDFHVGPIA